MTAGNKGVTSDDHLHRHRHPVGDGWTVTVFGLPDDIDPFPAPTLTRARALVTELITAYTGSPPGTARFELYVESVADLVGDLEAARTARERAVACEESTLLHAARRCSRAASPPRTWANC